MKLLSKTCLAVFLITGLSPALSADDVILHNGRTLTGRVLEKGETLRIEMIDGIHVMLPASRVKDIVVKKCLFDEYDSRRQKVADSDVAALVELAGWCKSNGLHGTRAELLQQVVASSPDHEEAQNGLGYFRFDGQWHQKDALLKLVRQPLPDTMRTTAESKLPKWARTISTAKSGLHISSVPAGLCVYVGRKEDVGNDRFEIANVRFLKGRTPLTLDAEPGNYVIALEQITNEKREFHRESGGAYYGKLEDHFFAGIVYSVEITPDKPSRVVGLFYPSDASQIPEFKNRLPRSAPFSVDRSAFDKVAENVKLPNDKRAEYFDVLSRAGKFIHPKGQQNLIVCLSGDDQFNVFTFSPR